MLVSPKHSQEQSSSTPDISSEATDDAEESPKESSPKVKDMSVVQIANSTVLLYWSFFCFCFTDGNLSNAAFICVIIYTILYL